MLRDKFTFFVFSSSRKLDTQSSALRTFLKFKKSAFVKLFFFSSFNRFSSFGKYCAWQFDRQKLEWLIGRWLRMMIQFFSVRTCDQAAAFIFREYLQLKERFEFWATAHECRWLFRSAEERTDQPTTTFFFAAKAETIIGEKVTKWKLRLNEFLSGD